jgi:outer membrane protein assembly factor BamD
MARLTMRSGWVPGALACALFLGACAGAKEEIDITRPITGDAATNAEKAYRRGLQEKEGATFMEATRYFEWVKNNFPYSQYAALSELALADMAFERDDFTTASTTYADFAKNHPSHPKAAYAAYRVGVASFRDRPSEWFMLPPAFEKDQTTVKAALDALQKFTLTYPASEYVPEAKRLVAECRERLGKHERYVADFYFKRDAWKGAAGRYLVLADQYGDLDNGKVRGEALWLAGQSYSRLGDGPHEREVLSRLVQEAPGDPHRRDAEKRLAHLAAVGPKASPGKETFGPPGPPPTKPLMPGPPSSQPRVPSDVPQPEPR